MFFGHNAAINFGHYVDNVDGAKENENSKTEKKNTKFRYALVFCAINAVLFSISALLINWLCFMLAPIALIIVLGYSYTKRFTWLRHLILALGLSIAPIAAYIAVAGKFTLAPIVLSAIVFLWTGGFDIIYSLPRGELDKSCEKNSFPSQIGRKNSFWVSIIFHLLCVFLIFFFGYDVNLGWLYYIGAVLLVAALAYQHNIAKSNKVKAVDITITTINGIASISFTAFFIASTLL
jgi:4-hydroxybenzoate polyprenyltransferase